MQSSRRFAREWLWFPLILLLMLAGCGLPTAPIASKTPETSPQPLPHIDKIETYLNQLAAGGKLSGAVLVAQNGMLFSKAYSLADKGAHTPNTTQTMFRIGSVTKQFTAMAILILQEHGKLHVQDHICLYIQDCPQDWQPITIQQLLSHTAGIPDYINSPDLLDFWTQPATPEQLIERFKDLPLKFAPGTGYSYSNSGYALLGAIIEHITGESYATFLRANIFIPLKMSHTGYDSTTLGPGHAMGYYQDNSRPDAYDMSVFYAAGALYSTVADLYTWDQALTQHKLISAQAYKDMFTGHACTNGAAPDGCGPSYGYGWFIDQGGKYIYNLGHIDGYYAYNSFYPEQNLDVIVLGNTEATDALHIGRTLASMV